MSQRQPEITELGVVDPLRLPGPLRGLVDRAAQWPNLAKIFIALAIVDLLLATGIFNLGVVASPSEAAARLASLITIIPGLVLVLLPAIITIRYPDARRSLRPVVGGACALALAALGAVISPVVGPTDEFLDFDLTRPNYGRIGLEIALAAVAAAGWVAVAGGLSRILAPSRSPVARAVAGAIAILVVASSLASLGLIAAQVAGLVGEADARLSFGSAAVGVAKQLSLLTFAYFAWVLVSRGSADRTQSRAIAVASLAAVLIVLPQGLWIPISVAPLISETAGAGLGELFIVAAYASSVLPAAGYVALALAFGLGLAEAPARLTVRPPGPDSEFRADPARP